jgi:outer membrane protein TolC
VRPSDCLITRSTPAAEAGIAFKGDRLRAQVQTERNRVALRQTQEQQRLAAAALAQTLHLDPAVDLVPMESDPAPLTLIETNVLLGALVQRAVATRPELRQSQALTASARESKKGTTYGPLIPSVGAQAFGGGLGGGPEGEPGSFGQQEDYFVGLTWRIGPGGLFDPGRRQAAEARLRLAEIDADRARDAVTRQVVDGFTRWQSLTDQLITARRALAAADEGLRLARERRSLRGAPSWRTSS